MMPILRVGGTRKDVVEKVEKQYDKYGLKRTEGSVEKHIGRTIMRIEKENKDNGTGWWVAYKVVSNTKESVKLELNKDYKPASK